MMEFSDTICAIATPPGVGGIGIIRISGPDVPMLAAAICDRVPRKRMAGFTRFRDGGGATIDTGLVLYFPGPHSFTGEDVLELQGHGGPMVLQMLLRRVMELGARPARPGEFSERAFLNDKLDLAQAEAIADLVAAGTEAAARAAQNSLAGVFSAQVQELQEQLTRLRVFIEAAIDFPEEEIDFLAESDVAERLQHVLDLVQELMLKTRQGRLLRDGIVMAIVGRPNAGKSSLLNALSGQDSAIVTEIPGTTRDVLREWIDLGGLPVHVADTAGIRDTTDRIEAEGVKRARRALESADIVLLVIDGSTDTQQQWDLLTEMPDLTRTIVVCNKMDLMSTAPVWPAETASVLSRVGISARTGAGLESLKAIILNSLGVTEQAEGSFSARQRHVDALKRAEQHVLSGLHRLTRDRALDLLAEELRLAQRALGEITGELLPDDLLAAIFASFCIGK